jgi:FAD/FMN-containing dehydrogenase
LHGNKKILQLQIEQIKKICEVNQALSYKAFKKENDLDLLWEYRRAVRPVVSALLPDTGILSAEVGVPLSCINPLLQQAKIVSKKYGLKTVMFGHMGDGNFHGWALYKLHDKDSWKKVVQLNEELITFAIGVHGTTTGEHGIGIGKRKFLPKEHPTNVHLMKDLKRLLDPKGILNPGKVFLD